MAQVWFGRRGDLEFGPWSGQQLRQATASGLLRLDDLVRTADKDKWVRAGDVKGLAFGITPVQPEPIQEVNSSPLTSPERRQPPPLLTKPKSGPPPLPTPAQMPLRLPVLAQKPMLLVGVCILGFLLVCGFGVMVTESRKSPTAGDSTGGPTAADSGDLSLCDLKGIYWGMPSEDFEKAIDTLGPPTLTGRHPIPPLHSYRMAAWKKKNGLYDFIWWIESSKHDGAKWTK